MQNMDTTPPPPFDTPGQSNELHTAKLVCTTDPSHNRWNLFGWYTRLGSFLLRVDCDFLSSYN
jgi:hypothetical protein